MTTSLAALVAVHLFVVSSGAAFADGVAFTDLTGMVIDVDIDRAQDVRRDGKSISNQVHQSWEITIDAEKAIKTTINTTFRNERGTRKAPTSTGRFVLDETRELKNRGGGQGAWSFEDGVLNFVRTFPSGAYRARFEFARNEAEITCKATEVFAREEGAQYITLESPFGGTVQIVNSKQLSGVCKVRSP